MDLVDYDEARLRRDRAPDFDDLGGAARTSTTSTFIPISALHGDNVVERSERHALVRRARPLLEPPRAPSHVAPTATVDGPRASRSSGSIRPQDEAAPRLPRLRRPGRRAACCEPGDEVVVLPSGGRTPRSPRSTTFDGAARRGVRRRCRSTRAPRGRRRRLARRHDRRAPSRRRRPSRASSTRRSAGWPSSRCEPRRALRAQAHDAHGARGRRALDRPPRRRHARAHADAPTRCALNDIGRVHLRLSAAARRRPLPRATAPPARSSSSTRRPTTRSAPGMIATPE